MEEFNKRALEYARSSLRDGLSLAQRAIPALHEMAMVVLMPEGASFERVLDFRLGGLGRGDIGQAAALLKQECSESLLVVELPLWRPNDVPSSGSGPTVVECHAEVYATCLLDSPLSSIEQTLRLADPSFMYNAIILESEAAFEKGSCPLDIVDSGLASIKGVLVGAFDGEGFVFARMGGDPDKEKS